MKTVPNLISYLHKFPWIFSQSLLFILSYFHPGIIFNTENADEWGTCQPPLFAPGPPVSTPSPRGCHVPTPRRATRAP
jgi:hypothetical protein